MAFVIKYFTIGKCIHVLIDIGPTRQLPITEKCFKI